MTNQTGVDWPTCSEDGCIGVQLARIGQCLAHATTRRRNAALKRFAETGGIDARGVPVTNALLREILRILRSARRDAEDQPTFTAACFQRATFHGDADFGGATFQGTAHFGGATFHGDAWFVGATFHGTAEFNAVDIQVEAFFAAATFHAAAEFTSARLGHARFHGAIVRRDADFGGTSFERARQFGPLLVYGLLRLDGASFAQSVQIEVSSRGLSCNAPVSWPGSSSACAALRSSWTTPTCPAPPC